MAQTPHDDAPSSREHEQEFAGPSAEPVLDHLLAETRRFGGACCRIVEQPCYPNCSGQRLCDDLGLPLSCLFAADDKDLLRRCVVMIDVGGGARLLASAYGIGALNLHLLVSGLGGETL